MNQIPILLFLFFLFSTAAVSQTGVKNDQQKSKGRKVMKQFINPDGVPKVPSYSQAVAVTGGKTIYISGQVSVDAKGETVGKNDFRLQIKQTLENLKTVLVANGASFQDVVKMTYFVKNFKTELLPQIREIRSEYLPKENPPASTLIGVTSLAADDFLIEIEAVAVVPQ